MVEVKSTFAQTGGKKGRSTWCSPWTLSFPYLALSLSRAWDGRQQEFWIMDLWKEKNPSKSLFSHSP